MRALGVTFQQHFFGVQACCFGVCTALLLALTSSSRAAAAAAAASLTQHEVLEQSQLSDLYNKGVFLLESVSLQRCLFSNSSGISLASCDSPTAGSLWKWVSRHRLFNLGTNKCMGINSTNHQSELGMFECDVFLHSKWWLCHGYTLYGTTQKKLVVMDSRVTVKRSIMHEWRIYGELGEAPCTYPYKEIHTLLGNAQGSPCALPFKYSGKWYWDCTSEGREDQHLWCATSSSYDQDQKWGFCPNAAPACDAFWESNAKLNACYQFNFYSLLSWSQALASCQSQGASLLSITQTAEHIYIRDRLEDMGVIVWTGLNHLAHDGGWQWSDGSPLALLQYTSDMAPFVVGQNQLCGVFNSDLWSGHWQSLSCDSALPYICKKTPNISRRAEPIDNWQYKRTECIDGWIGHNGFCYCYVEEKGSWDNSSLTCKALGAQLTAIHSLSEQELLLALLVNASDTKVWISLYMEPGSSTVRWSDGSSVTFTSWQRQQPSPHSDDKRMCVAADRKNGNWGLEECEKMFPAVCRMNGLVPLHPTGEWEEGCPQGWKRKGNSCYKIADQEQTFKDAIKGYYCKSSLVTIDDRFEQAFLNSLISAKNGSASQFYWTALQDQNKTVDYQWLMQNGTTLPLTYTNWNRRQPLVTGGGCVAMTGGQRLGHWEVKNCNSFKALAVCEQSVSSYYDVLFSLPHIDLLAPCKVGWESQHGLQHCYKVFHDEKVLMRRSWAEAEFFCRALGTDLASFHYYEEQVFVKQLLTKMFNSTEGRWFWVGLTKRGPQSAGAWEWSDGTPVVKSFIDDNNEDMSTHNCAVYSDLTNALTPRPCDAKHEWVCKVPRGVELTNPYWYNKENEPWVFYRGAEYYLSSQAYPWEMVLFTCKMLGADLLSLHSKEEQAFIHDRMMKAAHGATEWWIGLSTSSVPEGFSWTDGTALDYENWKNGRPSSQPGRNCVSMSLTGSWSTSRCVDQHGYVCKRRIVSVVETPREPHFVGACPENWFYFGHKCLLLHLPSRPKEGKSWKDAQSICSSFQGMLVSIEDEIEQAYITMLLDGQSDGVWIGLQDADTLKWTNEKLVTYTNWSPVEPEHSEAQEEWSRNRIEPLCAVLSNTHNFHFTGKWYKEKCSQSSYGFVCQKPQDKTKRPSHSFPSPASLAFSEYKNRSYHVVRGNMSWFQARTACLEKNAELVSITDSFHQAYLTVLVNRLGAPHWIGLLSQDDGINYGWIDGRDNMFTHWDTVDDDSEDSSFVLGNCVYMDITGGWRRAECDMPLSGALCYVPPPKSIAISSEVLCPETWVKFRQSCYNFRPVVLRMSLDEARERCKKEDNSSDVLTIRDEEENHFFLKQMKNFYGSFETVWLGIYYNMDKNALTWLDGSALDYTNWPLKAPDASGMNADTCVSMRVSDAGWLLADCTSRHGFICKTRSESVPEVEVEPLTGLHYGVVPAAVLVAILFFAVTAGLLWFVYKRNTLGFRRLPSLGSAFYSSHATDSDGNVLLSDLETHAEE
ncbi:secretory phospholipase A2 receptor [Clarias gariepinus]|uniref:secretory phospholipase A2 receptor n=1 Tax=Clarias gariepinus TaxID=13013 RepID=UPI00234D56C4|nr:secretory phospholipase A2 receptor [Clarias gariepinus]